MSSSSIHGAVRTAVALAIGACAGNPAMAAQDSDATLDEVVVTPAMAVPPDSI